MALAVERRRPVAAAREGRRPRAPPLLRRRPDPRRRAQLLQRGGVDADAAGDEAGDELGVGRGRGPRALEPAALRQRPGDAVAARGNCVAWTLAEGCWLKGARSAASPDAKLVSGFIAGRVGVDAAALKKLRAPAWVGTTPQERRRARTAPFACRGDRATALDGERHLYAAAPAADWSEAYPLGNGARRGGKKGALSRPFPARFG